MSEQHQTIWQIGKPRSRNREFVKQGTWTAEFNYTIGSDANPINNPTLPGILSSTPANAPGEYSTGKLNILFTLERDYREGELTLLYDRYGMHADNLLLDGKSIAQIPGISKGRLQQNQIPLEAVTKGKHTLTLTTSGKRHVIDYLKLQVAVPTTDKKETEMPANKKQQPETPQPEPTKTEQAKEKLLRSTGLEDYSYWWKEMAKNHDPDKDPPFRRGRIWH